MLRNRILTALVLIPLVVVAVLQLQTPVFGGLVALLVLLGAAEFARLAQVSLLSQRVFVGVLGLVLAWLLLAAPDLPLLPWLLPVSAWWGGITAALLVRRSAVQPVAGPRPLLLFGGGVLLVAAWYAVLLLHASGGRGPGLALFVFVLIWVADSGAYFAGRAFGRHKLAPTVSPGKTWEGAGGALLGASLCAFLLGQSGLVALSWSALLLLCVAITLISIGGDLWESLLKRQAGVKDSGSLLPGHGGILDRIDSLLAAAPVFLFGVLLLEGGL